MAPLQRNSDLICTAVMSPFAYTVHGLSFLFSFSFLQFSDLYESSPWSSYYLHSGITAFRYEKTKQKQKHVTVSHMCQSLLKEK